MKNIFIAHKGSEQANIIKKLLKKQILYTFDNKSNYELLDIYIKNEENMMV